MRSRISILSIPVALPLFLAVMVPASVAHEAHATSPPLTGLQVWYKADAGVTDAGGSAGVSGWDDQSGNDHDLFAPAAGNQPTLVDNVINGLPVLRFDGVGANSGSNANTDFLRSASNIDVLDGGGGTHELTTVVVFSVADLIKRHGIMSVWNFGSNNHRAVWAMEINGATNASNPDQHEVLRHFYANSLGDGGSTRAETNANITPTITAVDQFHSWISRYDGDAAGGFNESEQAKMYFDGQQLAPLDYPNEVPIKSELQDALGDNIPLAVGTWTGHSNGGANFNKPFAGDIAEILIYNVALSDADRTDLQTYVDNRFFPSGMPCDFDSSNTCDDADIDLLAAAVRNGTSDSQFNVDGLGDANIPDNADFDFYITDDSMIGTGHGDSDLNFIVNFVDFVNLSNDFGNTGTGWATGNFNTDDITNFNDFVVLSNNFGLSFISASNVPEPTGAALLGLGGLTLVWGRFSICRRGRRG